MGSVVFQAPSGGSTSLIGEDTASTISITVPAKNGLLVLSDKATGATTIPSGTSAQRPGTPVVGMMRANTTTNVVEFYNGTGWAVVGAYQVSMLVVGGGAGGGAGNGGAPGGGGGVLSGTTLLNSGVTYTIVVGAGGAGGTYVYNGAAGVDSTFNSYIGSGGGKAYIYASGGPTELKAGSGDSTTFYETSGGAGGAGANGSNSTPSTQGGTGGAGLANSITGSSVTYAGGGGGGGSQNVPGGTGGTGGGGTGGGITTPATAGTVNTGSGGGGGTTAVSSGSGGSGVVVLSIPTVQYTGTVTGSPTVTTSGSNTIVKFTSSGSYTA